MNTTQINEFSKRIIAGLEELKGSIEQLRADVADMHVMLNDVTQEPIFTPKKYTQLQMMYDLFEGPIDEADFEGDNCDTNDEDNNLATNLYGPCNWKETK